MFNVGNSRNDAENGHVEFLGDFFVIVKACVCPFGNHDRHAGDHEGSQADKSSVLDAFRHPLIGIEQPAKLIAELSAGDVFISGTQYSADKIRQNGFDLIKQMRSERRVVEDGYGSSDFAFTDCITVGD